MPIVHRARWLMPVDSPPLENGAVLVQGDGILACGAYPQVKRQSPANTPVLDHGAAALMPALVNGHTHLELSVLAGQIPLPQHGFTAWLQELLPRRLSLSAESQQLGFLEGEKQLLLSGTCLYGDITNGLLLLPARDGHGPVRQTFLEVLGFDRADLESALEQEVLQAFRTATEIDSNISLAAHACYSTSAALIRAAKKWCRQRGLPFAIHVAEHEQEIEFLLHGTGACREILMALGRWVPDWTPPKMSPVQYLDHLGALDAKTLLVHAVHCTESDWRLLRERRSAVCFCPRSNNNLQVGRPDIEKAYRYGIPAALGTDSLASNSDLNLFVEAAFILEDHAGVPPEFVLHMATLGGAQALGRGDRFGSIAPGKSGTLLAVTVAESTTRNNLAETVIHHGHKGEWRWANPPRDY